MTALPPSNLYYGAYSSDYQPSASQIPLANSLATTNLPVRPRKAKKHRRRHVPAGPAGVWYQQRAQLLENNETYETNKQENYTQSLTYDEDDHDHNKKRFAFKQTKHCKDVSSAWMVLQCHLQFVTPMLPAYVSTLERFALLRPHVPEEYLLLPQILNGAADFKFQPYHKLIVLVQTIHSLTDNLWTLTLTDETGATMEAWLEPNLVQTRSQSLHSRTRPGLLLLVRDATILLVPDPTERMLLIQEANIERVWAPHGQDDQVSHDQRRNWIEQRLVLTARAREQIQATRSKAADENTTKEKPDMEREEYELDDFELCILNLEAVPQATPAVSCPLPTVYNDVDDKDYKDYTPAVLAESTLSATTKTNNETVEKTTEEAGMSMEHDTVTIQSISSDALKALIDESFAAMDADDCVGFSDNDNS
jgi:hypothetical protein